jgi:hypothetical protein
MAFLAANTHIHTGLHSRLYLIRYEFLCLLFRLLGMSADGTIPLSWR